MPFAGAFISGRLGALSRLTGRSSPWGLGPLGIIARGRGEERSFQLGKGWAGLGPRRAHPVSLRSTCQLPQVQVAAPHLAHQSSGGPGGAQSSDKDLSCRAIRGVIRLSRGLGTQEASYPGVQSLQCGRKHFPSLLTRAAQLGVRGVVSRNSAPWGGQGCLLGREWGLGLRLPGPCSLPVRPRSGAPIGAPGLPTASVSAPGKRADTCTDLLTGVMPQRAAGGMDEKFCQFSACFTLVYLQLLPFPTVFC